MRVSWQRTIASLVLFVGVACLCETPKVFAEPSPDTKAHITENYGNTPLSFEANTGQIDKKVKFFSRGRGYGLYLSPTEAVMVLQSSVKPTMAPGDDASATPHDVVASSVLRMGLVNANPRSRLTGEEMQSSKSNYLVGKDPKAWRMDIANYGKVRYESVYKGIDLVYYGNQKTLEYDFIVQPGADYQKIRMQFKGADKVSIDDNGNLVLHTQNGDVVQHRPIVYQTENSIDRQAAKNARKNDLVAGRYILLADNQVAFEVEGRDPAKTLVIDPLIYATYLGKTELDSITDIAVDSSGNAYITGGASDPNPANIAIPTTPGAYQAKHSGVFDVVVTKLNAAGTALVYSTYIGGSDMDLGKKIAVDSSGNAYVSGWTSSTNFPTTSGAYQVKYGGGTFNAFVVKLNPSGTGLIYSTYIGGSSKAYGLAVNSAGNVYVSGNTTASNFPTTSGAYQTRFGGGSDVFAAKLNPSGTGLIYSTYIGGSGEESSRGMEVDSSGNAYMTGNTSSRDFPATSGAYQTKYRGGQYDVFVTKLNPSGTSLIYSTYIGSSVSEKGDGIAVDSSGNAYVIGAITTGSFMAPFGAEDTADFTGYPMSFETEDTAADSTDFPTTAGAHKTKRNDRFDGFVAKLNPTGSALVYSTFLDGIATGIVVDSAGNAYMTGNTTSRDFPTTSGASQSAYKKGPIFDINAFVVKLNPSGTGFTYSSYFGGFSADGSAIALDSSGNVYVAGGADSDFPATPSAFQTKFGGVRDTFLAKMKLDVSPTATVPALSCTSGTLYKASLPNGSTGSVCLSMKKVTTPSGISKLRGTATTSWRGFAQSADSADGSTFTFAWENYESDPSSGILYENNPAQGALFILAYAFPSGNCSGGASFFAVLEMPNAVSMTNFGSTINITPLFGQICGTKITSLTQYTLDKQ